MSIKEIFCQDKAVSILRKSFARDRVAHAYIFAGSEGVGKFRTAGEFAKLLLCKEPVKDGDFSDSCGQCESCRLFEAGDGSTHPDFIHVYKELIQFTRDGKGKKTPIELPKDVIREFLVEQVFSKPTLSARRVFVVSEAEKLNPHSQNSLLKTLEEPPGYCCIILLCTRLDKLLPTTRSRCQTIRFGPIDEKIIVERLQEQGVDGDAGRYFARFSEGSIGFALQLGQLQAGGADIYRAKRELVSSVSKYKYSDSLDLAEKFLAESKKIADAWGKKDPAISKSDINRRANKLIIRMLTALLQDAMKLGIDAGVTLTNFDQSRDVENLARRLDPEQAGEKIADCSRSLFWLESDVNEKLIFEQLLLNLAVSDKMQF